MHFRLFQLTIAMTINTTDIVVRKVTSTDLESVLELVYELAVYEKEPEAVTANINTYRQSFELGHFDAFVAEVNHDVIGVALYYRRFSTWKGPILYLEDFVVRSDQRGKGIGTKLFEAFLAEARSQNVPLAMWQVLDWNAPAIHFYDKYDVEYEDIWLNVKIWLKD